MFGYFFLILSSTYVISVSTYYDREIYRLPETVHPKWYQLRIVPDLNNSIFFGDEDIGFHTKFSTDTIILHANLTIEECQVRKGNDVLNSSFTVDQLSELLNIRVEWPKLRYGTDYVLSIKFRGTLKDDLWGFYKTTYTDDEDTTKIAAVTQFEPTYARRAFPCFDEPRYKTPFTITIAHYPEQNVISNMPIQNISVQDPTINNRQWTTFQTTPPIPTYLVAFMVSDFPNKTSSEKVVTTHTRPTVIQYTTYATEQGQKLFNSMKDLTGVDYPLPKLDMVVVPDFDWGGMENWGMITYSEQNLILDESNSTEKQKCEATKLIAHEVAHLWFGDFVTPVWWDYLWLKEGFATYYHYFNALEVESSWDLDQLFVVEVVQYVLFEELYIKRALTSSVRYNSEIRRVYDEISYSKAGSIIRMFEHIMTPNGFKSALNLYLLNGYHLHGGSVTPSILFQAFEAQAAIDSTRLPPHVSITDIMKSWTENIGYPLITVERNSSSGKIKFEQSTYKASRPDATPAPDQKWFVPISYATNRSTNHYFSDTRPFLWSTPNQRLEIFTTNPTDWVICNLQQSGYYRVNYCSQGWQLLIQQLEEDHTKLPILNRAQLIDDSFALATDGYIDPTIFLRLTMYLKNETEITPWLSATNLFDYVYRELQHTATHFEEIRIFFERILVNAYLNLNFEIEPTDRHIVKVGKPSILMTAARFGVRQVIDKSLKLYQNNINDLTKIPPDLKSLVFCNALRYQDDPELVYRKLWPMYLKSNIAYDSKLILTALGCAKDERILTKILVKIIDSKNTEIREQDFNNVVDTFFSSSEGVTTTIKFLIEKEANSTSEPSNDEYSQIKTAHSYIRNRIQTDEQIKLLEKLQIELNKHDRNKYGVLAQSVQEAHLNGLINIKRIENMTKKWYPSFIKVSKI